MCMTEFTRFYTDKVKREILWKEKVRKKLIAIKKSIFVVYIFFVNFLKLSKTTLFGLRFSLCKTNNRFLCGGLGRKVWLFDQNHNLVGSDF